MESLKRFWYEEDGLGTIEIIIIIVVLLAMAIAFRNTIINLFNSLIKGLSDQGNKAAGEFKVNEGEIKGK
ncbi:MAG: Flp1 family type IVb pilin [Eubacteriales bacterium]|nr:Flp1 family type IVb pilin [Eubacteriales bacterium]